MQPTSDTGDLHRILWNLRGTTERPGDSGQQVSNEKSDERATKDYPKSVWARFLVGRNRTIHDLDNGGGFGLVYARRLILLGKQLKESFVILHLAQFAGIFKGDRRNLASRNSQGIQIARVVFKLGKLATQRVDFFLSPYREGILIRSEHAHRI